MENIQNPFLAHPEDSQMLSKDDTQFENSDSKKSHEKTSMTLEWIKAIGTPLATLIVTLVGGYYFTDLTKSRELRESDERMYAQLLTQREQSEASIRKDMFSLVLDRFEIENSNTSPEESLGEWNNKVLQIEMLANNFSEALDLAALFKDLVRRLYIDNNLSDLQKKQLKDRLDETSLKLVTKQINSLGRQGYKWDGQVSYRGWEDKIGEAFIEEKILVKDIVPSVEHSNFGENDEVHFAVEIIGFSLDSREIEIRFRVDFLNEEKNNVDHHFSVSQYDFPMLDNIDLPYGLRASVVTSEFFVPDLPAEREANSFAQVNLVVFPAESDSFKERQDYLDIIHNVLRKDRVDGGNL